MNLHKDNKKIVFILISFTFSFVILYRYFWSLTPSWFIDSSTTLYLSENYNLSDAKVGLLSSKYIPQPNGMIIFGYFLKGLNNLIFISFFLSLIQLILFFLLTIELKIKKKYQYALLILLSTSTLISNFSVHFYNQWFVINFTILFFYLFLKFQNTKNLNYLSALYIVAVIPPALYLASIISSFFMILAILLLSYKERELIRANTQKLKINFLLIISFYLFLIIFVWIPFITSIELEMFSSVSLSTNDRLSVFTKNLILFVPFILSVFSEEKSLYIRFLDSSVITGDLQLLKVFYLETQQTIVNMSVILLLIVVKNKLYRNYKNLNFLMFFSFIFFYTTMTPLVGGNNFLEFDRMDQYLEVYPFYLILVFMFFTNFDSSDKQKLSKGSSKYLINFLLFTFSFLLIYFSTSFLSLSKDYFLFSKPNLLSISTYLFLFFGFIFIFFENLYFKFYGLLKIVVFTIFLTTNVIFSFFSIQERLNPPYNELTQAEVSIYSKYKLIDYLAPQILEKDFKNPKISYQLGGQKFEWINEHGSLYSEWYSINPYTLGRSFDYILLTEWKINNYYEGKQNRSFDNADYIISFSKDSVLLEKNTLYDYFMFDQLKLAVKK